MSVFISYSSQDSERVHKFAEKLRELDLTVWLDVWDIIPGDEISQAIEHGLEDSEFVVFMLSSNSVNSGWVDKEWRTKLNDELTEKEIKVICVRLDDCAIPKLLQGKKHVNAFGDNPDAIEELRRAIEAHRSRRAARPWLESAKWSGEAMGKHTPVALIRLRDSVVSLRDSMPAEQVIQFTVAETDFSLDASRENVALCQREDFFEKEEDGIAIAFNMMRRVAKHNAEANLREMEAWKRRLSFYLDRSELSPENVLTYLLTQLDKYIDEFTSE